jgi:hypothetical protein
VNSRVLLLTGALALVALAAAVIVILLTNQDDESAAAPAPTTTSAPAPATCENRAIVYFDTDDAMRQAAPTLAGDSKIAEVEQQTKAEAYARFKEVYAGRPELLELVRPETLPASLLVTGSGNHDLLADMRARFPGQQITDSCAPAGATPTN